MGLSRCRAVLFSYSTPDPLHFPSPTLTSLNRYNMFTHEMCLLGFLILNLCTWRQRDCVCVSEKNFPNFVTHLDERVRERERDREMKINAHHSYQRFSFLSVYSDNDNSHSPIPSQKSPSLISRERFVCLFRPYIDIIPHTRCILYMVML